MGNWFQSWLNGWSSPFKDSFSDGYNFGDVSGSLFKGFGNWISGIQNFALGQDTTGFWNDFTGKSNTEAQNSAAAAMQEDAQAFNAEEAQKERDFNAAEAEKARQWQEMMSNTAYQRSMTDLQAAGLNPWLAVGNGASSGSAVAASSGNASSGIGSAQASNVNMLASIGSAAAGIGILIKALKYIK